MKTMVAIFALMLCAQNLYAQDENKVEVDISVDTVSDYYFRGMKIEDDGFIVQPSFTVSQEVCENWTVYGNLWSSCHEEKTGASTESGKSWYEQDLTFGFDYECPGGATIGGAYSVYMSPNHAFDTVQEIALNLSYDCVAHPTITIACEVDGANDGVDEGSYLEIGVAPYCEIYTIDDQTFTWTFPVKVGFDLNDYYQEEDGDGSSGVGYVSLGTELSMECRGWRARAGAELLLMTDDVRDFNNRNTEELIWSFGIDKSF